MSMKDELTGCSIASPATVREHKLAYRISEACHALGVGRTSIYGLAKSGKIRLIKVAGRTFSAAFGD